MLHKKIIETKSAFDKCQIIWDHYLERKLNNDLEPTWIHAGYELVFKAINEKALTKEEIKVVNEIIFTHSCEDGREIPAFAGKPNSPSRIIHDGWKAGTPSWIFMGRSLYPENVQKINENYVVVKRTLPIEYYQMINQDLAPPTLWMAYHLKKQMGCSGEQSNIIGPAIYLNQILEKIENDSTI